LTTHEAELELEVGDLVLKKFTPFSDFGEEKIIIDWVVLEKMFTPFSDFGRGDDIDEEIFISIILGLINIDRV
jgi:hypothetical protein